MAESKYQIPPFIRRDGNALLYNGDGTLQYYIPENYFDGRSAIIEGSYIRLLGSFSYRIISKSNKLGELRLFNWPTVFLCRPSVITKMKQVKLDEQTPEADYRVLEFVDGDQLVSNVHTPQDIDNTKELLGLHMMTGKIPHSIPYDDLYLYMYESMKLNGSGFDIHAQLMSMLYSKLCRDPENPANLFRLSKAINKDMTSYIPMSVKEVPKYISPYAALTSENMDEGIVASVLLSDDESTGKSKHKYSPLEQVLTM